MAIAEIAALTALIPLLWASRPAYGAALLVVPGVRFLRRLAGWRGAHDQPLEGPLRAIFLLLPLSLLAVVDWSLATPKLLGVLVGMGFLRALRDAFTCVDRVLRIARLGVPLLGAGIAVVALSATRWPVEKLASLGPLQSWLPLPDPGVAGVMLPPGPNPNAIGGAIALVLPACLPLLLDRSRSAGGWTDRLSVALAGVSAAAMFAVLLLSQSRSAFLGCTAGVLAIVVLRSRLRVAITVLVVCVLVAGLFAVAATIGPLDVFDPPTGAAQSWEGRRELWALGLQIVGDFPFTGAGIGQVPLLVPAMYPTTTHPPDERIAHVHNLFLQYAVDLGVPGAAAMLWLFAEFLRRMWRLGTRSDDPGIRSVAVGLAAGLVSFMIYGLTDAITVGARGSLLLWTLLGLGAALDRARAHRDQRRDDNLPAWRRRG
jgi:putative inorganic carbon (hco3(-)) transporter